MIQKRIRTIIIIMVLAVFSAGTLQSCGMFHRSTQRKIERKQEKAQAAAQKEYKRAKKQHLKNQSEGTKKMMSRTDKKAKKLNAGKKRRLFNKGACN